ncbi:MAG: hypothetical protein LUB61_03090 [Eggerthellaceae bacterium]|nr:hypothetical protein [Eggerthellaceae bacterium]
MKFSCHQVYVAMFYALEAAFHRNKDEELEQYVSDSNPFLWKDGGSADPAVYVGFAEAFDKAFGDSAYEKDSLKFVRNYLKQGGSPLLIEAFDSVVTPDNWIDGLVA